MLHINIGGSMKTSMIGLFLIYVKQNNTWKLGSLSFTRLLTPGGE